MQSFILDRHTDPSNPVMKVTQDDKIPIYDSKADAEADLANIEEGAIVATKDTGATEKVVDVVEDGNMNPVTSNAVYDAIADVKNVTTIDQQLTFVGTFANWSGTQIILFPKGKWVYSVFTSSTVGLASAGLVLCPMGWAIIPALSTGDGGSVARAYVAGGVLELPADQQMGFDYHCSVQGGDTLTVYVQAVKVGE